MATSKTAKSKPAVTDAKPADTKVSKPAVVTLADVAEKLGRDRKSLRASIRRLKGGAQVGKGGRYEWKSFNDPELKKLISELTEKSTSK
jgi:hypothetical protein